nr:MAG TPA: hypothetical protein [Caudoviricetes sp.]
MFFHLNSGEDIKAVQYVKIINMLMLILSL